MAKDLLMAVILGGVVGGVVLAAIPESPATALKVGLVAFLLALGGLTLSSLT